MKIYASRKLHKYSKFASKLYLHKCFIYKYFIPILKKYNPYITLLRQGITLNTLLFLRFSLDQYMNFLAIPSFRIGTGN